jgi:hypothetical protein
VGHLEASAETAARHRAAAIGERGGKRQPFSPVKALTLLSTLQSADIVLPTTDGREIRLRRITEPTTEQKSLLHQLGLTLPERLNFHPKCSGDSAVA